MKKLLALLMVAAIVCCFAACGSGSGSNGGSGNEPTSIKFDADSYTVAVDEYLSLKDKITVEPSDATITYTVSQNGVCGVSKSGEVSGLKSGTVTITAGSSDGSVKDTCTVKVVGYGTVVSFDKDYDGYTLKYKGKAVKGGIRNARTGTAPEMNLDADARVLMIPQNMAAGVDMTGAANLNYGGSANDDGWFYKFHGDINAGKGYVVAKNDMANTSFEITTMPEGKYYALIVSSRDYTDHKDYSGRNTAAELKSSTIGKWFTDAELSTLAANFADREFAVIEFEVKAGETYYFEYVFSINA